MSESNYCEDCKRLKDIACTCGMTFAEKIKTTSVNWATWSDTRKALDFGTTCGYNNNKCSSFINRRRHSKTPKKEG